MEIPQGNTMENRTLKAGLSPPRAEEKVGRAPHVATLLIDFPTDFKDRALPPLHLVALSARNSSGKPFGGGTTPSVRASRSVLRR